MRKTVIIGVAALAVGLAVGFVSGHHRGREDARLDIVSGPGFDEYGPALQAVEQARAKLAAGNTDVERELDEIQHRIQKAQKWITAMMAPSREGRKEQTDGPGQPADGG